MDGYGRILTSMFAQYSSMITGNRWDGISGHGTDESKIACGVVCFFLIHLRWMVHDVHSVKYN
jgi:hypothetical protein